MPRNFERSSTAFARFRTAAILDPVPIYQPVSGLGISTSSLTGFSR